MTQSLFLAHSGITDELEKVKFHILNKYRINKYINQLIVNINEQNAYSLLM